jgi:hypothetical protein
MICNLSNPTQQTLFRKTAKALSHTQRLYRLIRIHYFINTYWTGKRTAEKTDLVPELVEHRAYCVGSDGM